MTTYLRFANEAEAKAALPLAVDEDGSWRQVRVTLDGRRFDFDVIGPIPGVEGFHVNVLGEPLDDLSAYVITPANPVRVFA